MTSDAGKTRAELIEEIRKLRQRLAQLEAAETVRDIEELREDDHLLSTIFNNTSDLQVVVEIEADGEFRIRAVNQAYLDTANQLGLDFIRDTLVGITLEEAIRRVPGPDRQEQEDTLTRYRQVAASCRPVEYTERLVVLDQPYHSRIRLSPICDSQGTCRYVLYTSHDITEHTQALQALQESEERHRLLFEHAGLGIGYYDTEGTVIALNRIAAKNMGGEPQDFVGQSMLDLFGEEAGNGYHDQILQALESETPLHYEYFVALPASERWMLSTYVRLTDGSGTIKGVQIISTDISEHKRVEQALRENETNLARAQQIAHLGNWDWDLQSQTLTWSDEVYRIFGVDQTFELSYERVEALVHPDDCEKNQAFVNELLTTADSAAIEFRIRRPDGSVRHLHQTAEVQQDENGRAMRIFGIIQDITDRKQAEEAMTHKNKFIQHIVSTTPGHIYIYDFERQQNIYSNPFLTTMLGYSPEKFQGVGAVPLPALIHPDDKNALDAMIQRLVHAEDNDIQYAEYRFRHKNGSWVWVADRALVFQRASDGQVAQILGVAIDITTKKQSENILKEYSEHLEEMVAERTKKLEDAQEQLLRRGKLAVLGQLAGSVAHELRHPLGILSNAAYFLTMSLSDADETTREYLAMITSEIRKADKIISDLLGFSRNQTASKGSRTPVQLSELIAEVLAEQPPPEGVGIVTDIAAAIPPVSVDVQQIEQVLVNLILNAYQAMPEGGTLTVGGRQAAGGRKQVAENGRHSADSNEQLNRDSSLPPAACRLPTADCVLLTVQDTGGGIAPEHLKNLFEPLFTTKPKGIGLGLAISKTLVEANGGTITIENRTEGGTTVAVMLPCEEEA